MQSNTDGLRSVQELPEKYQVLFPNYPCFNRVQSAVFDDLMESSASLVVTAPTGSGKTAIFELALVKLLTESQGSQAKAVYIAPVKALCSERFQDWKPRFEELGVSCVEITGDSSDQDDIRKHQIILTTPEKWDSITRRWRDNSGLVQMIQLIMIDEVHLLSDPKRGPTLEAVVSRMKTVISTKKMDTSLRFIAVSATIVNLDDLAKWLSTSQPAKYRRFGNEMRPVALNRIVKGFPQAKSPYLFDIQLSYKLKPIIAEYSEGKPVLIFCSTRRGVFQTCKTLLDQVNFALNEEQRAPLLEMSLRLDDAKLREFVKLGAAYHHAGLTAKDRTMIQDAFMQGSLPILIATSTLAMGVNLPAHLVIIKSTHQYLGGRVVEYPEASILQMVGRAGRPQFDTSATAVIMTKNDMVERYTNLLDCKEVLESSLHKHLAEHLNSEIVLHTIVDLAVAMEWLRSTFLYQRAMKAPGHYGMTLPDRDPVKIEKQLELLLIREFNALQRAGLVTLSDNGLDVSPTDDGKLMSFFYIHFNTFKLFADVSEHATIKSLLEIISKANELSEVSLRINERRTLNELNSSKTSDKIRFPLEGKIKTREMKIEVLTQACLGCIPIPDPSLMQEALRIVNLLERIVKSLTEYLSQKNYYCALLSCLLLHKCLHAKLWENSLFVARQLDRIGPALGLCLVRAGKTSFNALMQTHPRELERIMNRGPPFGGNVLNQIKHLPRYRLDVRIHRESVLLAQLFITVDFENREDVAAYSTAGSHHAVHVIVGDTNNRLLLFRKILDRNIMESPTNVLVTIKPPMPQKVFVNLVSEQWVGLDRKQEFPINPMATAKVGADAYLPVVEEKVPKRKKNQAPSQKITPKPKEDQSVRKITSMLQPKAKAVPKRGPIVVRKDIECCFDLEPDLYDLSIVQEETHGAGPEPVEKTALQHDENQYEVWAGISPPQQNYVDANLAVLGDAEQLPLRQELIQNEDHDVFNPETLEGTIQMGRIIEPNVEIEVLRGAQTSNADEEMTNQNTNQSQSPEILDDWKAREVESVPVDFSSVLDVENQKQVTEEILNENFSDNLSHTEGVWQITQLLQPAEPSVESSNFDISFNLTQENEEVRDAPSAAVSMPLSTEPVANIDDCSVTYYSPPFKKKKVTFFEKADDTPLMYAESLPKDQFHLEVSPPHPILLEPDSSEGVVEDSVLIPNNQEFETNYYEHMKPTVTPEPYKLPEITIEATPSRPKRYFACEIQNIVGKMIHEKVLSSSQMHNSSQNVSWAHLESQVLSQSPRGGLVKPSFKRTGQTNDRKILEESNRSIPLVTQNKRVGSLKRALQRNINGSPYQDSTSNAANSCGDVPEKWNNLSQSVPSQIMKEPNLVEPLNFRADSELDERSASQPVLKKTLITEHFQKVSKPLSNLGPIEMKSADCKSLMSQLLRLKTLKQNSVWYDVLLPAFICMLSCLACILLH